MRKPNLFVIGAMKAGTTTLHDYLASHPRVFMSHYKEPNFFVEETNWRRGFEWYLGLFRDAGDAVIVGESSTDYTKLPRFQGVSRRLHDFAPRARLIYLLRDPIERTISHYWWRVRFHEERRGMLEAIRDDSYFREVSNYAMQLQPYLGLFGEDVIRVETFERLVDQPAAVLREVFEWLGVDPGHSLPFEDHVANPTPDAIEQVRRLGLNRFRYSRLWNSLGPLVPRRLRSTARMLAVRDVQVAQVETEQVVQYLRPIQQEETEKLTELLGRQFSEWKMLYGER